MTDNNISTPKERVTYQIRLWPEPADAAEYGALQMFPFPEELVLFVGRVILFCAMADEEAGHILRGLCRANGTTLDNDLIRKHGKKITRLQAELDPLKRELPETAKALYEAAESLRAPYKRRGNLAHGEIGVRLEKGEVKLISTGKYGTDVFTQAELRDLALRFSRAWYELKGAFDLDRQTVPRSSLETQTLRDFLASNPQLVPRHAMQQPQPQSSETK